MKKVILSCAVLLIAQCAFCEIVIDKLPDVQYRNPDGTVFVPDSASYPKITQMETLTFGQSFENEPIEIRLNRLEGKLYKKDYSALSLSQRVDMIASSLDEKSITAKDRNTLSSLERKIFNKAYTDNSAQTRVERLEKHILGANQSGNLNSRINTLKTASSSLENNSYQAAYNPNQYQMPPVYDDPYRPQSGVKNALRNIFGVFSQGSLTGFTPPVNYGSYDPYQQYSANNSLYNGNYGSNYGGNYGANYNNPSPYANNQGFYYPKPQNNTYYQDIYKDNNGDEMYYTDGQYRKDIRSTSGGCGVTIIN